MDLVPDLIAASGPHPPKLRLLSVAQMDDDSELVARLRQGDMRALEIMYERYARAVFLRCWRTLREREAAWEATERTFLAFLIHLPGHRGDAREWLLDACSRITAEISSEAGRL